MSDLIKLTDEQEKFLEGFASIITMPDKTKYYYMPFYFKENNDSAGYFEIVRIEHLPIEVINFIKEMREKL